MFDISVLGAGLYGHASRTGVARVIQDLAQVLVNSTSIDITFCATRSPGAYIQTLNYFQSEPWTKTHRLAPPENHLFEKCQQHLSRFHPAPGKNRLAGMASSLMLRSLNILPFKMIPRGFDETDVFHSTYMPIPRHQTTKLKAGKVLTVYDLIPVMFPQFCNAAQKTQMRKILASIDSYDQILTISESTKSDLCEFSNIDPKRVQVTHLGASGQFSPCTDKNQLSGIRRTYGIPDGPYILSLCTFEPRKNIDQTIRSFVQLVKEQGIRDLNLVLVGTRGWDFDKIFNEIKGAADLRGRIITTGFVLDEDLSPLYSGAMMFVYPSLYEGFGLPPLEAMQCGVPVITSNTSSLPEVVGNAGIMVNPTDGDAISQAMLDLYRNSAARSELSARGIERAGQFSWKKCADQTVEAYQAALDSRS